MDNYFCPIPFFQDLIQKIIYATGMIRSNRIGLPFHLKNTKEWKWCKHGHIEWAMHNTRGMSCIMWKNKHQDLLISTYIYSI
jgi:hypothetical protein